VAGDARSEILEGLSPDARVVALPGEDLDEGRRARIRGPGERAPGANAAAPAADAASGGAGETARDGAAPAGAGAR
jgi:hypothetical protein